MQETHVWGCLAVVLAFSCTRAHANGFASIVCITLLLLTLVPSDAGPHPPSIPPSIPPPIPPSGSEEDSSEPVSARAGEMVPNPRLAKDKSGKEDDATEEGNVLNGRTYGQAAFRHMLRRKRASQVALSESRIKDAISTGFRP